MFLESEFEYRLDWRKGLRQQRSAVPLRGERKILGPVRHLRVPQTIQNNMGLCGQQKYKSVRLTAGKATSAQNTAWTSLLRFERLYREAADIVWGDSSRRPSSLYTDPNSLHRLSQVS